MEEVKLLDFQLTRVAQPEIDLIYVFSSSLNPETRSKHMDDLLQFYHKHLTKELAALGYSADVFTYEELKENCTKSWVFAYSMAQWFTMVRRNNS